MPERPPSEDLEVDGSPGVVLRQHSSPGTESLHGIAWSMMSACYHVTFTTGYPLHRENRENGPKKIPVRENMGNLEILTKHRENAGNLVCLGCKFLDSKGKRYFDFCHENF